MFYEVLMEKRAQREEDKRKGLSTGQLLGVGAAGTAGGIGATLAAGVHNDLLSRATAKDIRDSVFYPDGSTYNLRNPALKNKLEGAPRGLADALDVLASAQESYAANDGRVGTDNLLNRAQLGLKDALSERSIQKNRLLLGGTLLGGGLATGYGTKRLLDRYNARKKEGR